MYARSILKLRSFGHAAVCFCLAAIPAALMAQTPSHQFSDQQPEIMYQSQSQWVSPTEPTVVTPPTPIIKTGHQFALNAQGILQGRISNGSGSPSGLTVFIVKNKQIVGQGSTDSTGWFSIAGTKPGNYSLFVAGNQRFAAQGISIIPQGNQTNTLELTTVATQYDGLQKLINDTVISEIADATRQRSIKVSSVISEARTIDKVRIINRRIRGQISSLISQDNASGVQIHLIQNGQPISQVETNSLGSFIIPDVEPGIYDFIAVGKRGFAALQIEAIGNRSPMQKVAYQADAVSSLEVPLAEDVAAVQYTVSDDMQYTPGNEVLMEPAISSNSAPMQYAGESIACGCAGGGTSGTFGNFTNYSSGGGSVGGRFGGRFGGQFSGGLGRGRLLSNGSAFGRLLTLGALGGSITAIADRNPSAASPTN